jgi:hypothetical protein
VTAARARPRLLHTIVAMGVALTGGSATACGGIASSNIPPGADGGGDVADAGNPAVDGQTGDHYAMIGIAEDAYPVITPKPDDAYPTIGYDADHDGYPTIGIGPEDAYPTIGIDAGSPDGYPIIH